MLISRRGFLGGTAGLSTLALLPRGASARNWPLQRYMRELHTWHCRTFFDFDRNLGARERRYIDQCIDLMDARAYRVTRNFFYSTNTYSHRVRGNQVNSSRIGYGSLRHRRRLQPAMAEILRHRGIDPGTIPNFEHAFGMGWDVEADHLKVYIHLPNLREVRDPGVARLASKAGSEPVEGFGLTSYTFRTGKRSEEKLYVAVRADRPAPVMVYPFADAIRHTNYMITNHRGVVPQVDLVPTRKTEEALNAQGKAICDAYRSQVASRKVTFDDAMVDTIAYQSKDEFTLYF